MTARRPATHRLDDHGVAGLEFLVATPVLLAIAASLVVRASLQLSTVSAAGELARVEARRAALGVASPSAESTLSTAGAQVTLSFDATLCRVRAVATVVRSAGPMRATARASHVEAVDRFSEYGAAICAAP